MFFKKLLRTVSKYKAQFISMIIMIALGMGVFIGFHIEWYSIEKNTNKYLESNNYADYRIYSSDGFSDSDINNILNIDGVDDATRWFSTDVGVTGKEANISLNVVEKYGISTFELIKGSNYDESNIDGIWLSDLFAKEKKIKVNDVININYLGNSFDLNVIGLIKSPEYMVCTASDNQLMPDYSLYGYGFVTPHTFKNKTGINFYTQINIKSKLSKEDLESKINNALSKTILLLSLEENKSYAAAQGEIEEGKTMGSILPVLFMLIAILTMITTMHRIMTSEKTQIGTFKALGFKDKKILLHYMSYGLFIGILGCVFGVLIGYLIAAIVINPTGMMSTYFDWPEWKLYMPWFCPLSLVVCLLILIGISYISVKEILKTTPAEALKPYSPKTNKKTKLEKTRVWSNLSFGTKWNYRDINRNKSRTGMTLIGVVGCVVLILASLGMRDTMVKFTNLLDEKIIGYNAKINLVEGASNDRANELAAKYSADTLGTASVKVNDEVVLLEIYDIRKGLVGFIDENDKDINLSDDGVYICMRLANLGIKIGDTIEFSPYGSISEYSVKVIGINRSITTETITMSKKYAESINYEYSISSLFTENNEKQIETNEIISSIQSKKSILDTYDTFMEIMNMMIVILIVGAILLGVVVLYNLGVMNYSEKYREYATLKVVGLKDSKIAKLLVSQNLWITIIGIVMGIPLAIFTLKILVKELASEYELSVAIGALSYMLSIVLVVGVSLIVTLIVANKNKKIDMVEALKGNE